MRVALFVPCYVEQFYPQVGLATLDVLERHGVSVTFPEEQTCCGQPMANAGSSAAARPLAERFLRVFAEHDYVVAPSGSCVAMVRVHYDGLCAPGPELDHVRSRTYELCEFLVDVLKVDRAEGRFPHKVGLHQSCHGLRELRLGTGSERRLPPSNKVQTLLAGLEGIQLVDLARPDECCGFGGTFAVTEEAISARMGRDRLDDHQRAGAEVVTAVDMSCLMHLEGLIGRERRPLRVMHVAQILAESAAA
jgi:L-lactate dehydrogenase complex protein LldE